MYSGIVRTINKIQLWQQNRSAADDSIAKYKFDRSTLDPARRKPGLSGYMRLKNEEDFLGKAIESCLPFLDELVIVYNNCTDRTPDIAEEYQKRFPDKIKVYHYEPRAYHQSSTEYHFLPGESPHSFVNHSNYALSKTTHQWAVKIDGDQIVMPGHFGKFVSDIRQNGLNKYRIYKGINLWDHDGKIYVNGNSPFCGLGDVGFFPVSPETFYIFTHRWGLFVHKGLKIEWAGILFFHVKGMKKDRGLGNYELEKYPKSKYHKVVQDEYTNPRLITWEEFREKEPIVRNLPSPESLGITPLAR